LRAERSRSPIHGYVILPHVPKAISREKRDLLEIT
jgi:hypothetical protein